MMTSAIRTFQKLSPRMRALYVASLALSVALMAFGAVLLASSPGVVSEGGTVAAGGGSEWASEAGAGVGGVGGEGGGRVIDLGGGDKDGDGGEAASPGSPAAPSPTATTSAPAAGKDSNPRPEETERPSTQVPTPMPSTEAPSLPPSPAPTTRGPSASPAEAPSASPTFGPTEEEATELPTASPHRYPTHAPSVPPSYTARPTASAMPSMPRFYTHIPPVDPSPTYFDYDPRGPYGPSAWGNVTVSNATDNYWSEFGLVANQCNLKGVAQSPIDVCTSPERHCMEHHEFRSKRGDFKISSEFMAKQILPNKLRVIPARRTGDEPDPPHADFAGVGATDLDLLNIDVKVPSEHTVCGRRYDAEMQYYFFHPVKRAMLVVAWLLDAREEHEVNEHLQLLIDEFEELHDANEEGCAQKALLEASDAARAGAAPPASNATTNGTASATDTNLFLRRRRLAKEDGKKDGGGIWDPFHRDIQKTIHFWGYHGTLTEPPCAAGTMWRIMDVPVPISLGQLWQMQDVLFNHRDNETCAFTSTHYRGSVARPLNSANPPKYYKCTRTDYVSDDEREVCGDAGCAIPFGTGLDPYVEPVVYVTGPPSEPPTRSPLIFHELG